jgi:hypothetical protein
MKEVKVQRNQLSISLVISPPLAPKIQVCLRHLILTPLFSSSLLILYFLISSSPHPLLSSFSHL